MHAALSNLIKLGFNSGKWQRRWVELQGAPDPMLFYYAEKTAGAEWFNGANCKNGTNKKEKGVCLCGVVGGGGGGLACAARMYVRAHAARVCVCVCSGKIRRRAGGDSCRSYVLPPCHCHGSEQQLLDGSFPRCSAFDRVRGN